MILHQTERTLLFLGGAAILVICLLIPLKDSSNVGLALLIAGLVVYFAPSIVGRRKRNFSAIFFVNLLLGWTAIGWIVSMAWALTKDSEQTKIVVQQNPGMTLLCSGCGRYSQPGSKFCANCGAAFPIATHV